MLNHCVEKELDYEAPLYNGSPTTKGKFAEDLTFTFDTYNIAVAARDAIVTILQTHLGNIIDLPTKLKKDGSYINKADKYSYQDYRAIPVHICELGCMVYIDDKADLIRCSICNSPRYTPCSHRGCRDKEYDSCPHSKKNRVAKKVIHYRPIIPLLRDLLILPKFRNAIQYANNKMEKQDDVITDVLDGIASRSQWKAMEDLYNNLDDSKKSKYINIPILLSYFFDGANIFDRQNERFHALVTTILNLHPSLRVSDGFGMFVTAINTSYAQSSAITVKGTAERLIFSLYFVKELELLAKGFFLDLFGIGNFFLQG